MADRIQIRRDSAANWTSSNPTLAQGELGVELDTSKFKVGDGATAWNSLGYVIDTGNYLETSDIGVTVQGYDADTAKLDVVQTFTADQTFPNVVLTGYLAGPASFVIDPAAVGDNTGTVVIAGDLQVDGTTTTINSTTLDVADLNITVADGAASASAANGAGLTIDGANISLSYDHANTRMNLNSALNTTGAISGSGLTVGAVTYAATDGTNGQILTTDGSGNATFADAPASGITTGKAIAMAIVFG